MLGSFIMKQKIQITLCLGIIASLLTFSQTSVASQNALKYPSKASKANNAAPEKMVEVEMTFKATNANSSDCDTPPAIKYRYSTNNVGLPNAKTFQLVDAQQDYLAMKETSSSSSENGTGSFVYTLTRSHGSSMTLSGKLSRTGESSGNWSHQTRSGTCKGTFVDKEIS